MPSFGRRSRERLATCDPQLVRLFERAVGWQDCTVLCGYRGEADQEEAFRTGHSRARFGQSLHNRSPSAAIDVAPWPVDWSDRGRFYLFAGRVLQLADDMGIRIRYGGDWDQDGRTTDQKLDDLVHFELLETDDQLTKET